MASTLAYPRSTLDYPSSPYPRPTRYSLHPLLTPAPSRPPALTDAAFFSALVREPMHYAGSGLHAASRRAGPTALPTALPTLSGSKDPLSRTVGSGHSSSRPSRRPLSPPFLFGGDPYDSTAYLETSRLSPPHRLASALELASSLEASSTVGRGGRLAALTRVGPTPRPEDTVEEKHAMVLPLSPTLGSLATGSLSAGAASPLMYSKPGPGVDPRVHRPMVIGGLPGGAAAVMPTPVRPLENSTGPTPSSAPPDDAWAMVNDVLEVRHPWRSLVGPSTSTSSGLSNLGNTCFMNSCLQCLVNLKPLVTFFLSGDFRAQRNGQRGLKGQLAEAFGELTHKMWDGGGVVAPNTFKQLVGTWAPAFQGSRQHDAQEFLRLLLDGLHEDLNRVTRKMSYHEMRDIPGESEKDTERRWWEMHRGRNASVVMDLFCGHLRSTVRCLTCGHVSIAYDPFLDLSLNLPTNATTGSLTLVECLTKFSREETLTGPDAFYCSHCQGPQDCVKQIRICRLPPVLVVHFKRFAYNSAIRRKLGHDIQFPAHDVLDMVPYCYGPASLNTGASCAGQYVLHGVIHHMGTMEGGHYTAHCRSAANNHWYEFDDSRVTKAPESAVGGPSAYVLFYRLVQ